jgi:hypothetical protein
MLDRLHLQLENLVEAQILFVKMFRLRKTEEFMSFKHFCQRKCQRKFRSWEEQQDKETRAHTL